LTEQMALQIGRDALTTTLLLAAPPLGLALMVGLAVSILQAVTQINEVTLTFVPKILAVFLSIAIFGPWMINTMVVYAQTLLVSLPMMAR